MLRTNWETFSKKVFKINLSGSALIIVIIIIAILSTVLLGAMSAVLASLNQSTSIYQKSATGYGAESAAEEFLYYFNQLLEDAKNIAYGYYYKGDGTLKDISPGRVRWLLGDESYEPGKILDDLRHGRISRDVAEDKVYEGMKAIIRDEVSRFMNDVGSDASIKVEFLSLPEFKKLSDLVELYIKPHYESLTGYELDDITVNAWSGTTSGSLPDGYTIYIDVSKKRAGTSSDKEIKRTLRLDVEILATKPNGLESSVSSATTTAASSIFNLFDYALYTNGSFVANVNFTIIGGNVHTGGDIQSHGGLQTDINNLVVMGELSLGVNGNPQVREDNVKVSNVTYIRSNLRRTGVGDRNISLQMGITYVGGNAELYGRGRYEFDELYCDGNVIVKGSTANAVDVVIKKIGVIRGALRIQDQGTVTIKSGAVVYCDSIQFLNNPTTLVIENGATIVTRMPPDYSRIVNSGGVINVVSSVPYPPLPQILNEIRNFSFPNSTSIPSITPHDPVPPASIDSAADISKSPPQVVVIGENCNAGEIEVEIQNRLASMGVSPVPSPLQLHVFARNNITISVGTRILNGQLIALGNTLNINSSGGSPFDGVTLIYGSPSSLIQNHVTNTTGYVPPATIYNQTNAIQNDTLYSVRRRNIIVR
ncbi:hypothetical protein Csac_1074 [Caldicellulosiruptor saccharolyticus DSM 8903]|uniref:Uncharacterized protein n=1 Tax=Caldicellulosiruptor saccharolyticus (strain ATCC 43494 / DSM 8903 / Tp8T 6331) TaxID=351627 RepID=A4XIF3_CALS8|nr:hypothetical protein [Caldicellulosiruptor saccharolyticus]ABP66688.1 hypothetical protein Csac_1074 [Caldicellulosiruptor saccharolyticus DSM 8903]